MKKRLQDFGHRASNYERPSQNWICGRSTTGRPCSLGPDKKGSCRTLSECRPRRNLDGWVCSRPKQAGGACEQGPLPDGSCCRKLPPCVPVRSLRARRGRFTAWSTAVCFGLLLFLVGSRMNADMMDAGTMNAGHAEVEACGDCHVAFDRGPVGWLAASFAASDPVADSEKCLACHKKGQDSLNAHTLPQPELTTLIGKFEETAKTEPVPWTIQMSRAVFPVPDQAHDGQLACGACHKEHKGEDSDLVAMTNARCQSCHQLTFPSFSDNHPSFGDYPYVRRTRIIFDHDSHNRTNFPEKAKQGVQPLETCDSCHVPDATGQFMLNQNFEETCALCHNPDIIGETVAGPKGTPVIALPELDLETLQDRGISIGEWPEAPFAYEISPYTKLLISADPAIADDLAVVDLVDLQDMIDASDEELQAVARVAWAIKELIFDLTISGMDVLETRVEASLDSPLDTDTVGRLIGHIPQDLIASAGAAWFPNLKQEVVAYRENKQGGQVASAVQAGTIQVQDLPPGSDPTEENDALGLETLDPEEWAKAGGWYRKDYILYYRPVGHEDAFLRTWLDISAQSFGTPAQRHGEALFGLIADSNTPGKCMKCHSVDQLPGGGLEIQWGTFQPVAGESRFTTFAHSTHFSAVGDDGCVACHKVSEDAESYQASYEDRDPLQFAANFAPMQQEVCAECHVEQSAGDACTQCHQYHVGEFATEGIPPTRIQELDPAAEQEEASVDNESEGQGDTEEAGDLNNDQASPEPVETETAATETEGFWFIPDFLSNLLAGPQATSDQAAEARSAAIEQSSSVANSEAAQ